MSNAEQSMQIYGIISQIEQMIEESPHPKFGGSAKRIVDMEELLDLLGDLKATIPEDLRRANSLLVDSDTMLENARENAEELVLNARKEAEDVIKNANAQAERMLRDAETEFEQRVSDHEILQEAQRRAQLLAKKAEANAIIVYDGAKQYADEVLADIQKFLNNYQNSIMANRRELDVLQRPHQPVAEQAPVIAQQSHIRSAQPVRQVPVRTASADTMPEEEQEQEEYIEEKKQKQPWWKLRFRNDYEEDAEEEPETFEEEDVRSAQPKDIKGPKQKSRWNRELDVDLDEK